MPVISIDIPTFFLGQKMSMEKILICRFTSC